MRELYPPTSKYARRGVGNFAGAAPLAPEPTTAPPGTADKMKVMLERAGAKLSIFHPADAAFEGDPRPVEFLNRRTG